MDEVPIGENMEIKNKVQEKQNQKLKWSRNRGNVSAKF